MIHTVELEGTKRPNKKLLLKYIYRCVQLELNMHNYCYFVQHHILDISVGGISCSMFSRWCNEKTLTNTTDGRSTRECHGGRILFEVWKFCIESEGSELFLYYHLITRMNNVRKEKKEKFSWKLNTYRAKDATKIKKGEWKNTNQKRCSVCEWCKCLIE